MYKRQARHLHSNHNAGLRYVTTQQRVHTVSSHTCRRGTYRLPNGEEYEGQYAADRKAGKGTYRYPDGQIYDGEWASGAREGCGT